MNQLFVLLNLIQFNRAPGWGKTRGMIICHGSATASSIAEIVNKVLGFRIGVGEGIVNIMDVLNAIMPDILPLGIFVLVYWLLKKGTKATTILLGIIVVSIVGSAVGIF